MDADQANHPAASLHRRSASRPVAAPGAARGGRRAGRGRLSPGAGGQRPADADPGPADRAGRPRTGSRTSARTGSSRWSTRTGLPTRPAPTRTPWILASTIPAGSSWTSRTTGASSSPRWTTPARAAPPGSCRAAWPGTASTSRCRKSLAGQQISIEFDGVYRNSNVYLNGKLLGNHPYAYTGFSYDLTGLVHTDGVTRGRDRGQRGRPAAEQPLVLRRRHLPQRLPGHHRRRSTWRGTAPS